MAVKKTSTTWPRSFCLELDDLLPIVDGATLLGFATAREGDVKVTPEGKEFAEADISARKSLVPRSGAGSRRPAAKDEVGARE
jgi:hypothetical protein